MEFGSVLLPQSQLRYIMSYIQYVLCISNVPLLLMVLRFASQKVLNLSFRCLIFHLIRYIQKNKDSKNNTTPLFVRMTTVCVKAFVSRVMKSLHSEMSTVSYSECKTMRKLKQ